MTEPAHRPSGRPELADLADQSGAVAIEHVLRLLERLEQTVDPEEPAIAQCLEELRRLVSDVASLRNATSLLSQQLDGQDLDQAG